MNGPTPLVTSDQANLKEFFDELQRAQTSAVFIPVCFYTKRLLRRPYVTALLQCLSQSPIRARFLFADYLHTLNLQIRGFSPHTAAKRSARAGANNRRMYEKALVHCDIQLSAWNDIASTPQYQRFYQTLFDFYADDPSFRRIIKEFIRFQQKRSGWDLAGGNLAVEREYLMSEIAMSIVVTEIDGFSCEIWAQQELPEIDPIGFLYAQRSSFLREILAVDTLRRSIRLLPG